MSGDGDRLIPITTSNLFPVENERISSEARKFKIEATTIRDEPIQQQIEMPVKQQVRNLIDRFENPKASGGHKETTSLNASKFAAHDSKISNQIKKAKVKLDRIFSAHAIKQECHNHKSDEIKKTLDPRRMVNRIKDTSLHRSTCSSIEVPSSHKHTDSNALPPLEATPNELNLKISNQNEKIAKFPKKVTFQDKNSTNLLTESWAQLFAPSNTEIQLKIPTLSFVFSVPTYDMLKRYLSAAGSGLVLVTLFPCRSKTHQSIESRLKIMDKMASRYPDVSFLFAFVFPEAFARTTHMNWPILLFYKNENVVHEELWDEPLLNKKSENLDNLISKFNVVN